MANYHSSYTGAEIDASVGKASKLPTALGSAGQILRVNSQGDALVYESKGTIQQNDPGLVTGGDVFAYIQSLDADNTSY